MALGSLPVDVLLIIFGMLSCDDRKQFKSSCRAARTASFCLPFFQVSVPATRSAVEEMVAWLHRFRQPRTAQVALHARPFSADLRTHIVSTLASLKDTLHHLDLRISGDLSGQLGSTLHSTGAYVLKDLSVTCSGEVAYFPFSQMRVLPAGGPLPSVSVHARNLTPTFESMLNRAVTSITLSSASMPGTDEVDFLAGFSRSTFPNLTHLSLTFPEPGFDKLNQHDPDLDLSSLKSLSLQGIHIINSNIAGLAMATPNLQSLVLSSHGPFPSVRDSVYADDTPFPASSAWPRLRHMDIEKLPCSQVVRPWIFTSEAKVVIPGANSLSSYQDGRTMQRPTMRTENMCIVM